MENVRGTDLLQGEQLAALAHDLRTPMCCVEGAAQMALDAEREGKDVSAQLRQILSAVRTMDGMIERVLRTQEPCAFSADLLAAELMALCMPQAACKGQRLSMDLSALGRCCYTLDYGSLMRVLSNLLGNAIKYTPEGGAITLRAQVIAPSWHCASIRLRFIVADNGMGMKKEFLRRLYAPHARAKESAHLPGKGLGLAIVRRLVREMGGTIQVRSEWGRGTAFAVTIPAAPDGGMLH